MGWFFYTEDRKNGEIEICEPAVMLLKLDNLFQVNRHCFCF